MYQNKFFMVIICLLIAGFVFAGCESVIGVDLPEHTSRLSATSFFNPDSTWQVYVSNTVPYSASMPPPPIQNAQVLILSEGQVVDSLVRHPFIGEGFYISTSGSKPVPEKPYTIRVRAPGFDDIEGEDIIPRRVAIQKWTAQQTSDPGNGPRLNVSVTFDDPAATRNYYAITVLAYINNLAEDSSSYGYSYAASFTTQDPAITGSIFLGDNEEFYTDATFNDDLFSGESYTLDLEVELYYLLDRPAEIAGSMVHVACLQSVSEDLYRYWRTSELQRLINSDYFAEPVQVFSNLSSETGVFGGYQQQCEQVSEITF